MRINRRELLKNAGLASGAALFGAACGSEKLLPMQNLSPSSAALPNPADSGIDHIVVVTMENRSFDHFMGWLPNANGKQAGLTYVDNSGVSHSTHSLSGDNTGCPHPSPDHSYYGGRVEYDSGSMDGFLRAGNNDVYSIGYYGEADVPFYAALARNYLTCDRYFAAILGPTFPNRLFIHAAQTDRLDDSVNFTSLPAIWDELAASGVSANYYFSNVPFTALWGTKYLGISKLYAEFLAAAATGTLPAVSFVDPKYTILDDGEGNDDHPHADLRAGEAFMGQIYRAVTSGPKWANTVLIFNRDEWGGFYDTVTPPRVIAANDVDTDIVNGQVLLGCRVPTIVVSPFTRGNTATPRIDSTLYDHTSVLKLIEWRYNLPPLSPRDASNQV